MPRLTVEISTEPMIGLRPGERPVALRIEEQCDDGVRRYRKVASGLVPAELFDELRKAGSAIAAAFPQVELVWIQDGAPLAPVATDWKLTKAIKLLRRFL